MDLQLANNQWFAVMVRARWENSTESLLRGKGYETFLPTYRAKRSGKGRNEKLNLPLFPSYVFCRFDVHKRLPVLTTPGVVSIVGCGKIPIAMDDDEISAVQAVVRSGISAEPWPYLGVGERVRIHNNAMSGLEGILVRFRGTNRIVISVSLLRRSIALEVDRSDITPIRSRQLEGNALLGHSALVTETVS